MTRTTNDKMKMPKANTFQIYTLAILIAATLFGPLSATANQRQNEKAIAVEYNKNVELLGFVYFLGFQGPSMEGNEEIFDFKGQQVAWKDWYSYGINLYQEYQEFAQSEHLQQALGQAPHVWLDYYINLLLQVDDFPNAKITDAIAQADYLQFSQDGNADEALTKATNFVNAMNAFYMEVSFDQYLEKNSDLYSLAIKEVSEGLPAKEFLPAMEQFYQKSFDQYVLMPSLTLPSGMGFGILTEAKNATRIYNVFGSFDLHEHDGQKTTSVGFNDTKHIRELSTHEFGHSFVNSVIDIQDNALITATEPLFAPVKDEMEQQGYGTWKICLYEHFVRAGEVLIAQRMGFEQEAENLRKHYIDDRSFIYLPHILEVFENYDGIGESQYQDLVRQALERMMQSAEASNQ